MYIQKRAQIINIKQEGDSMPSLVGQTLRNRYRVDDQIGRGGMAEDFKVWDFKRAVPLAMKLLREDLAFMLMDYVEGTTLRKEIFRAYKPFSHKRILEVMRPVCSALHYDCCTGP
jgi:serine/threonine protein kinase